MGKRTEKRRHTSTQVYVSRRIASRRTKRYRISQVPQPGDRITPFGPHARRPFQIAHGRSRPIGRAADKDLPLTLPSPPATRGVGEGTTESAARLVLCQRLILGSAAAQSGRMRQRRQADNHSMRNGNTGTKRLGFDFRHRPRQRPNTPPRTGPAPPAPATGAVLAHPISGRKLGSRCPSQRRRQFDSFAARL